MHTRTALNGMRFDDGDNTIGVAIFPSSPETGLATISGGGPILLSTEDVTALRDLLNLALEQAGSHPFTVVGHAVVDTQTPHPALRKQ
jgi:hypothetical protein